MVEGRGQRIEGRRCWRSDVDGIRQMKKGRGHIAYCILQRAKDTWQMAEGKGHRGKGPWIKGKGQRGKEKAISCFSS